MKINAEKIRQLIKAKGWNQRRLAIKTQLMTPVGLSRGFISVILKRGSASLPTIEIIATTLGVKPEEIILED